MVQKAQNCLMDGLGCLLAAYDRPEAQIWLNSLADMGIKGDIHIIGSEQKSDCSYAAFAHANLINMLDFDDIYKKGHLGATVISAALAVGEKINCNGAKLLEAIVVGYEVSGRVGISMSHSKDRKTVHGHGTWQVFGAVATTAKLLKLDSLQTANALAIAAANAPLASVMKTVYGDTPNMAKNNFGIAAQVGVNSAFLARNGGQGPLDVFEGDTGFWRMFGADGVDMTKLTNGLGEDYEILHVGFKPYSCCRILQSSIEASLQALAATGSEIKLDEIEKLIIDAPAIICKFPFNNKRPNDMWTAQFSSPYTMALALSGVAAGPDWFDDKYYTAPNIIGFMDRIELKVYGGAPSQHHAAKAQLFYNGKKFTATISVAKGEAANPLSNEFLTEKFLRLANYRLTTSHTNDVLQSITHIQSVKSIRPFIQNLCV